MSFKLLFQVMNYDKCLWIDIQVIPYLNDFMIKAKEIISMFSNVFFMPEYFMRPIVYICLTPYW